MLTQIAPALARPYPGARAGASAEPFVPPGPDADVLAGLPATFSRAVVQHRLGAAALDTLVEHLPVGVLVAERKGRLVYANAAARRLGADALAPLRWALTRALLTESAAREDGFELRDPNGERRSFNVSVLPVWGETGAMTGAVLTLADVTDRRLVAEWEPVVESLMNL